MHDKEKVISCLTDLEQIMITRQAFCPSEELQYWIELQEGIADAIVLLNENETVVRCKDCKHGGCRTQNMDGSIFRVVCKKHSTKRNERWMDANWFCADGVAKDINVPNKEGR